MWLRFNPSGITNVYVFNNGVWALRQSQDKNNPNLITYTYSSNKLASITDTQGRQVTFAYTDPNNNLQPSSITDTSLSRTISLTYGGPSGALSQVIDAAGAHTTLAYDANGLSRFTDANSHVTYFDYDTTDRLAHWKYGYQDSAGAESDWAASYDSAIQTTITNVINPNDHTQDKPWIYTIDSGGRVTGIKDPNLNTTTSAWAMDGTNDLQSRTSAMNDTTNYSYGGSGNPNNMLSKITSPNGAGSTSLTGASQSLSFPTSTTGQIGDYQPNGTTDAQGNTSTISYGGNSHQPTSHAYYKKVGQNQVLVPGAESATYGGDSGTDTSNCPNVKNGETCTSTDANGNITKYAYDSSGNVTTVTPPAPLGAKTYTYDAAGRVTSATDGRGNTAYISYDADDRTTQVSYSASSCPAASCVTYVFDGAGNLTSRTSATETTTFTYDALNRPKVKQRGSLVISTATYDAASNLTSYTDASGTVVYGYDKGNQLVSLAEPNGSCGTNPGTNPAPNSTGCTYFQHDKANRRIAVIYPSGQSIVLGYDHASRVTSIKASTYNASPPVSPPTPGYGTVLTARNYTYATDSGGNDQALLASMTADAGVSGGSGVQTSYGYTDGRNRLNSATVAGTETDWKYDANGNRTQAITNAGNTTTYSAYNAADEICWTSTAATTPCTSPPAGATTYGFDASGNQTGDNLAGNAATNAFNVFNQITSTTVAGTGSLASTYTDTNNTERLSAGATSFLSGTLGMTSQTTSGTTINYVRDPFGNLIALHDANGSHYYTIDAQGSVLLMTNAAQTVDAKYTYDVWGNPTSATGTYASINPWRYAGGYLDGTGHTKLGARYYNPTTGRFTQPDPSHQESNNYTYAGANPANNTDPTGLDFWSGLSNVVSTATTFGFSAGILQGGAAAGAGCVATAEIGCFEGAAIGFVGGFVSGFATGFVSGALLKTTEDAIGYDGP